MALCDIQTALQEIRSGRMIILVDDEGRENEGDFVIAADKITPESINFMAKYGRGLICLALSSEIVEKLNLPLMTTINRATFGTNFTVSIEASKGVTTGISAFDRATTILAAVAENAAPEDIVSPGHIFPLRAQDGGVLKRTGHTEGGVDLAKLAGCKPGAVICEIMNENGTMARLPQLEEIAKQHNLKIASIKDLIKYRLRHDKSLIQRVATAKLPTVYGDFTAIAYGNIVDSSVHLALVKGTISSDEPVLARVHSECLTGDVFGSKLCECGPRLQMSMKMIGESKAGVFLYLCQEGTGIGLIQETTEITPKQDSTIEQKNKPHIDTQFKDFGIGAQILLDLGANQLRLLTNNPKKLIALDGYGLHVVEHIPLHVHQTSKK